MYGDDREIPVFLIIIILNTQKIAISDIMKLRFLFLVKYFAVNLEMYY